MVPVEFRRLRIKPASQVRRESVRGVCTDQVRPEHDPEEWNRSSEKFMLKQKLERDDDSKKCHSALAALIGRAPSAKRNGVMSVMNHSRQSS
jgi:hypothetical protein